MMKLNRFVSVVLMSLLFLTSFVSVSTAQADGIGTSKNTIYFPEDYNPWNNGNPDPEPPVNGESKPDKPTGFFPQTGEVKKVVISIIGFIILLLVGLTIYLKSKNIKKEK